MSSNEVEVCRRMPGIKVAVEKLGSQVKLAAALGVTQQVVSLWCNQGFVPTKYVPAIRDMTGLPASSLIDPITVELAREVA